MITQDQIRRLDFNQASNKLLRHWDSSPFNTPLGRAGFAGFLLLLCLIPLIAGPILQYEYAHDAFILLDGAWRVLHGQRPQVDFSTNLGPLVYLFTAAGIAIGKQGGHALVIAQSLFGGMIAALAYWISVRRLPRLIAVTLSTTIVLLALAPYNLGEFPFLLTFGMMYNRIGYALIGIILIEATRGARPGPAMERDELLGGILTGFICSFLFFLKITYFLVAVVLILALLPYRRQFRERFVGIITAGLAFALLMLGYLRFDIPAILREFRMSAGGKHIGGRGPLEAAIATVEAAILLVILGFLFAWLSSTVNRDRFPLSRPWAILVTGLMGFGLLATNHQLTGQPLDAFICLLIASEIAISTWPAWKPDSSLSAPALLLVIGLCAPLFALIVPASIAYALPALGKVVHWQSYNPDMRLAAPAVSDFRSRDVTPRYNRNDDAFVGNYASFVNDGLRLLQQHSAQNESVVSLDFSNPFSFSLGRTPPHQGTTCLHYSVTFDDTHKLSPDQLFGDAKLVMVPKVFSALFLSDAIARIYIPPLLTRFRMVAESDKWTLFRRLNK